MPTKTTNRLIYSTLFSLALSCQAHAMSTDASAAAEETAPAEQASAPAEQTAAPAEPTTPVDTTEQPVAQTAQPAADSQPGFFERQWNKVVATYHSPDSDLFIPLYTWHNRSKYDPDKIDEYNENPWGLGYGRVRYDADGDQHTVYAMVFLDSHDHVEPFIGYAFEKIWRPSENTRLGLGFTLGITMRSDYDYIPIPAVLPILSFGYRRFTLETTYIPGGHNNGNVLFTWARWSL